MNELESNVQLMEEMFVEAATQHLTTFFQTKGKVERLIYEKANAQAEGESSYMVTDYALDPDGPDGPQIFAVLKDITGEAPVEHMHIDIPLSDAVEYILKD